MRVLFLNFLHYKIMNADTHLCSLTSSSLTCVLSLLLSLVFAVSAAVQVPVELAGGETVETASTTPLSSSPSSDDPLTVPLPRHFGRHIALTLAVVRENKQFFVIFGLCGRSRGVGLIGLQYERQLDAFCDVLSRVWEGVHCSVNLHV